ncbi:FHA domain-containing protein [Thalassotalea nanhaiensis]|uniref:FHA domain-containing protein n=1 Tax=Thalassotalea nanhaiensis TaxID=3065648 RepID=A0ABY9TKH8_9GAMM|nr:FHA domain-containing protein [Colwelliaceae bacterium SQ345]
MELIIEEISRGKKLIGRHKFATSTVNVGRAYNNDIILSDPHICPEHLALKCEDGIWYIKDLESLNGSVFANKQPLTQWQALVSGDIIRLGKTQLRFYLPNHPVSKSVEFSELENAVEYFGRWSMIIAMVALFGLINFAMLYLNDPNKEIVYSQLFIGVISVTIGYALWPLLCSLMAFLNKHEPRVGSQLGVSFVIINMFWILDFIDALLGFNISSQWSWHWLLAAASIGLTFSLFWFNFYIAFQQSPKRRFRIAAGLTIIIYGGLYMNELSDKPEFNPYPVYNSTVLTPIFSVAPASSSDEFIKQSDDLFIEADKNIDKK